MERIPELRVLRYFVLAADAGSVNAAAQAAHITQPALSRQLKQLEKELGLALLVKRNGRLVPSTAGEQFLPIAKDLLNRAAMAVRTATSLAAGRLERITIAAPPTTLTDMVAPFVATLSPEDPVPSVFEFQAVDDFNPLEHGADLAIFTEAPPAELRCVHFASVPLLGYVPEGHPWAGRKSVTIAELATEPLVALPPVARQRQVLDSALSAASLVPRDLVETSNAQVAQALCAAGRGVAIVTDDPRFDLVPFGITSGRGTLKVHLHAAWEPTHHAQRTLESFALRMGAFALSRYGRAASPTRPGKDPA